MKKQKSILKELKLELDEYLPGLVSKIIFYGSYVRGDSHKDSDLDVLLIVNKNIDWKTKDIIYEICNEINIKYDVWIDVNWINEEDLKGIRSKLPFIQKAFAEGVTV